MCAWRSKFTLTFTHLFRYHLSGLAFIKPITEEAKASIQQLQGCNVRLLCCFSSKIVKQPVLFTVTLLEGGYRFIFSPILPQKQVNKMHLSSRHHHSVFTHLPSALWNIKHTKKAFYMQMLFVIILHLNVVYICPPPKLNANSKRSDRCHILYGARIKQPMCC